jgi:hypothetical protein
MKKAFFTILMFFVLSQIFGQTDEERLYLTDTVDVKKRFRIIPVPIVFYTPETQFGFGAGVQTFLYSNSNIYNSRESNILLTAMYTTRKQFMLDVTPKIYFNRGDLFFDGLFRYRLFPNRFWGIGNNTPASNEESYNMETIIFEAAILKRLPTDLNFGFQYKFDNYKMIEIEEGGLLDSALIPGSEGARISAIFFHFNLDDRDNVFSTRYGNYMQLKAGFSSKVLGATYGFNKYIIDLRKYFVLGKKGVVATQIYFEGTFGNVPFQSMAWLGGGERTRGYFRGRFIDHNMYAIQAEYRNRLHKRWILAAFASVGEVAGKPLDYFNSLKYSFGGGVRFQLLKNNPTLVRLDFGIGRDGNNGIYFGVNEAF